MNKLSLTGIYLFFIILFTTLILLILDYNLPHWYKMWMPIVVWCLFTCSFIYDIHIKYTNGDSHD